MFLMIYRSLVVAVCFYRAFCFLGLCIASGLTKTGQGRFIEHVSTMAPRRNIA